ncbi:hypothetical protein SBADM41S_00677 [Streptomyces badius]
MDSPAVVALTRAGTDAEVALDVRPGTTVESTEPRTAMPSVAADLAEGVAEGGGGAGLLAGQGLHDGDGGRAA